MPQPPPVLVTRPHPGRDQRLEDRIQPPPQAFSPRLPSTGSLRSGLHPPITDSHKARTNSRGPVTPSRQRVRSLRRTTALRWSWNGRSCGPASASRRGTAQAGWRWVQLAGQPPASLTRQCLCIDCLAGSSVLSGKPVVSQMQVDPCRLDRAVPGLGPDRLKRHPRFAEPGEAGVTQLMTGQLLDAGPGAGAGHDLVQTRGREWLSAPWSLQDQEDVIISGRLGALRCEVGGQACEEALGDRDDALVAALALGDKQSPLAGSDVSESKAEDLTTTQATKQHRLHHRLVSTGAQSSHERVRVGRVDHTWQRARSPDQRDAANRALPGTSKGQPPRHRTLRHRGIATDDQVLVETSDGRQPTLDGPSRQAALAVLDADDLGSQEWLTLSLDEGQYVARENLNRLFVDDPEEDLQIKRCRQHRVRPSSCRHQVQIGIQQRVPETDQLTAARTSGAHETQRELHERSPINAATPPARPR